MRDFDVILRQRDRLAAGDLDFEVIGQQTDAATDRTETGTLGQLGLKKVKNYREFYRKNRKSCLPIPFSSVPFRCSCRDCCRTGKSC